MIILQIIQKDWSERFPSHVYYTRRKGLCAICFWIICMLYYMFKTIILFELFIYYLMFLGFKKAVLWIMHKVKHKQTIQQPQEQYEQEVEQESVEDTLINEQLPFCQLFNIGEHMCLLIDHIEMCPDETAFIRVVDDEGYTPLYKRKVKRDKSGARHIVFDGKNYYLIDEKTQPIINKENK